MLNWELSDYGSLALTVATHAISEFGVGLDQLHNDSTTITFHGDYPDATHEERPRSRCGWRSPGGTTRTTGPT